VFIWVIAADRADVDVAPTALLAALTDTPGHLEKPLPFGVMT
jgi:hypothetical protein